MQEAGIYLLAANWTGTCTLAYLSPLISVVPREAQVPLPMNSRNSQNQKTYPTDPPLDCLGCYLRIWKEVGGLISSL